MTNNGRMVGSGMVSPQGVAVFSGNWEAPRGSTPYFGFMDDSGGYNTLSIEAISLVGSQNDGRFLVVTKGGQTMKLPAEAGFNLMKRLGWTDRAARKEN